MATFDSVAIARALATDTGRTELTVAGMLLIGDRNCGNQLDTSELRGALLVTRATVADVPQFRL